MFKYIFFLTDLVEQYFSGCKITPYNTLKKHRLLHKKITGLNND
ncbi:hypothetical protein ACVWV0_000943 [Ewingella americana]